MKLGLIARMDHGGLAWQSHSLARMLNPDKILLIDSRPFNGPDVKQCPERFDGYEQHDHRRLPDRPAVPRVPRRPDACADLRNRRTTLS